MRWNLLSLFPTASINRNYTFKKGNYEIFIIVSFSLFCTVNMYSNEKVGLTLIPPGKISNKINLDIRGGIVNRGNSLQTYQVSLFGIKRKNLLYCVIQL